MSEVIHLGVIKVIADLVGCDCVFHISILVAWDICAYGIGGGYTHFGFSYVIGASVSGNCPCAFSCVVVVDINFASEWDISVIGSVDYNIGRCISVEVLAIHGMGGGWDEGISCWAVACSVEA
jgi:hypothetical protein